MSAFLSISIKNQLLKLCLAVQQQKVETFKKAMDDAQHSANSEEKSTAGDKYDTARAMSQNERDMNAKQLQDALRELGALQQINPDSQFQTGRVGSLINSSTGLFFISIGLGELTLDGVTYYAISPASPMGQVLIDKVAGEKIVFRGKTIEIKEIL